MTRYFSIDWFDLDVEAQERIVDSIVESLREDAEFEGRKFMLRSWNDPKPQSWQEAYVRYYSISNIMWVAYERAERGAEVPSDADWASWLEDHLRSRAEDCAYKSFKHLEVGVEL